MLISFDELTDGLVDATPVVIVGAGPAGISLALDLARRGVDCLLIEAGGYAYPSPEGLDPYQGKAEPRPYPVGVSRLRYFGGTSGHWGGWCRPLDPVDFERVEGVAHTGWPISRDEAYVHLDGAHKLLEIPDSDYDSPDVLAAGTEKALKLAPESGFTSSLFRFSPPTRFGERYRSEIEGSRQIRCLLRTSLVKVERGSDGRSRLQLMERDGRTRTISARFHVLAMGGIENARALLWSNVGNERPFGGDWVGRAFSDHFGMAVATILAPTGLDYAQRTTARGTLMPRIIPMPAKIRGGFCRNHMFSLSSGDNAGLLQKGYGENRSIFGAATRRLQPYHLTLVAGSRPNRDSRVLLDDALDNNGVARTQLDWRVPNEEFAAVLASTKALGLALATAGIGRMRRIASEAPSPTESISFGMHHIGTTRMADSEKEGVVDGNCRVFGSEDLYMAGSSVFPTSGYANPTLTLVALALRLSEHLAGAVKGAAS